jgi:beta-galactosidase
MASCVQTRHTGKMSHPFHAGYIRARDPSRPVHYEGGGSQTPATDIVCPMYARIPQITRLADDPREHRPVIQCEYAHAMGNGTGNYREYWDAFHAHPHLQVGL